MDLQKIKERLVPAYNCVEFGNQWAGRYYEDMTDMILELEKKDKEIAQLKDEFQKLERKYHHEMGWL